MSDAIKHECGVVLVRLLKPLAYYQEKYGNILWGFQKLFLLMEKQRNRGQDGAGIGALKLAMPAGKAYMFRERDNGENPISTVVNAQMDIYNDLMNRGIIFPEFPQTVKDHFAFGAEVMLGHLRYGTSGDYSKAVCQPYFRRSPWPHRNLMLAGNFNITNVDALNERLIDRGAHPIFGTDTQTVLEEIGYQLDKEHRLFYGQLERDHIGDGQKINKELNKQFRVEHVLKSAASNWDGGYVLAGILGNGSSFVLRDPNGIRPAWYYQDDEALIVTSERVALMTILDKSAEQIKELPAGGSVITDPYGNVKHEQIMPKKELFRCSFERIYFSRGNDPDIYRERKLLGAALTKNVMKSIDQDLANAVFSYIPNTAETAYYGLIEALNAQRRLAVKEEILDLHNTGKLNADRLDPLLDDNWPRGEKIAVKDLKLRTFISKEKSRIQLATHIYDIAYGVVGPEDVLVCLDDSIVRGTTLKQSILRILSKANPKKIVIASTAPQIRYPDCYGIDMSELGKFIAFQAAIALLKEHGMTNLIDEVYQSCIDQSDKPAEEMLNHVKRIYEPFSISALCAKIADLVFPDKAGWKGDVEIIFQSIYDLHACLPEHKGDWYFTGDYPTPGGNAVVNRAFIHDYEGRLGRAY